MEGVPFRDSSSSTDVKAAHLESTSTLNHSKSSRRITAEQGNGTIFARVAYNQLFQNITMVVIVVNALWIGIDTEWNHKQLISGEPDGTSLPLYPVSFIVETIFCTYFTIEVAIRFLAFKRTCDCVRDAWFVFDFILVLFMVIETWILKLIEALSSGGGGLSFLSNFSALRLLRLLRLTRMARLMRFVPELMTIVKGMVSALKSVFFILLFLMSVTYVFAICFTSLLGEPGTEPCPIGEDPTAQQMFATLGDSMMTLITIGILGDNLNPVTASILEEGELYFWLFMVFFIISCLTLLNMLIGVLCDVISGTAKDEEDTRQIGLLKMCISDAFDTIDLNQDGLVSEEEWKQMKKNENVRDALCQFGIEEGNLDTCLDQMQASLFKQCPVSDIDDYVAPMSSNGGNLLQVTPTTPSPARAQEAPGLPLEELVEKVSELRPDVPASCLELSLLQSKLTAERTQIAKRLNRSEALLTKMIQHLGENRSSRPGTSSKRLETAGGDSAVTPLKVPPQPPDSQSVPELPEATADDLGAASLGEVPSELLLHVLKLRQPNPAGGRKSASMSPGHASYSCLQQISTDARAARAG